MLEGHRPGHPDRHRVPRPRRRRGVVRVAGLPGDPAPADRQLRRHHLPDRRRRPRPPRRRRPGRHLHGRCSPRRCGPGAPVGAALLQLQPVRRGHPGHPEGIELDRPDAKRGPRPPYTPERGTPGVRAAARAAGGGHLHKAFRSGLQPVEIGHRVTRVLDDGGTIGVNGGPVAPNNIGVYLSPDRLRALPAPSPTSWPASWPRRPRARPRRGLPVRRAR